MNKLLIIFVKNPELGKVKTRLAQTVGDEKALEIYKFLLNYTRQLAESVTASRAVYYTNYIDSEDIFEVPLFQKYLQSQGDLGDKMYAAFQRGMQKGEEAMLIIGSDCFELSKTIIDRAFEALKQNDFVIGPAKDGGYYLLGMRRANQQIFLGKNWSTSTVYADTIADFEALKASYAVLPTLSDIDYKEDLGTLAKRFGLEEK